MRKFLFALLLAIAPSMAYGQASPCPTEPAPVFVRVNDSSWTTERDYATRAGACIGLATYMRNTANALRFEVDWAPCPTTTIWRKGAQYTTMTNALTAARRPPACAVFNETVSATNSSVALADSTIFVGDTAVLSIVLRNAQNQKVSPNKVISTVVTPSSGVSVLPTVTNADSTYTVRAVATAAGTFSLALSGANVALTTRSLVVSAVVTPPPPPPAPTGVWQQINPPINLGLFGQDQFGFQTIALSPANPSILYIGTCYEGIWKSVNGGQSWFRVSTGVNGPNLATGRNWSVAVDPTNADIVYTVAGYGSGQGIWKSTNGGVDWVQLMNQTLFNQTAASVYNISIDPANANHLLVGFHQGWAGTENSGVMESLNGGATWILHQPQGFWGKGNYALFIDSSTWLLATQEQGFWRTANAGATWTQVVSPATANMPHGAGSVYRSANGVVYTASSIGILRSTNNGATWTQVGPRNAPDGYMSVIGDGVRLYTQRANTGNAISGPLPYYTSLESDGVTWVPYNGQTFTNGPGSMAFDPANRILYSSNWLAGVWKLNVGGGTPPAPVDTVPSLTASSYTVARDSMFVDDSVEVLVYPRNAAGTLLQNRTVTVRVTATDNTSQVFPASWDAAKAAYGVFVSSPVVTTLTVRPTVNTVQLSGSRTVRVVARPVAPPPVVAAGCALASAAFCETFTTVGTGGRGGELDPARWSTARTNGGLPSANGSAFASGPATIGVCRAGLPAQVFPPQDVVLCDSSAAIRSRHLAVAVGAQNYGQTSHRIRQPFDFSGRTGRIMFDAEGFFTSPLHGWFSVTVSEDPTGSASFILGASNDEGGAIPRNAVSIHFQRSCGPNTLGVRFVGVFNNHVMNALDASTGACVSGVEGRLNRFTVELSQTRLTVRGTNVSADGSTYGPAVVMFDAPISIPFSVGYVALSTHNHATAKYTPGFGSSRFLDAWVTRFDNVSFDGPVMTAWREYEVPDSRFASTDASNQSGPVVNAGYRVADMAAGPAQTLTFRNVNLTGMTRARISVSNYYLVTNGFLPGPLTNAALRYRLNGGTWRERTFTAGELAVLTAPDATGAMTHILDVPMADLRAGDNTIEFTTRGISQAYAPIVSAIDLILTPDAPVVVVPPVVTPPPVVPPVVQPPVSGAAWLESFTFPTDTPATFTSSNWNVQRYQRDRDWWVNAEPMMADHGDMNCAGPPAQHYIDTYDEMIFMCRDHLMTAIKAEGYGVIQLTPNRMARWDTGPVRIAMNLSAKRVSKRDWLGFYITPYEIALPLPAPNDAVSLNGAPRDAVWIMQDRDGNLCGQVIRNHIETKLSCVQFPDIEARFAQVGLTTSASRRDSLVITLSRTSLRVTWAGILMSESTFPAPLTYVDRSGVTRPFTEGVVQLGQYSYNPTKDCTPTSSGSQIGTEPCNGGTWHWDEISISNAVPFTIINAQPRAIVDADGTFTLAAPAPANAMLRFSSRGVDPDVSFNNGATWVPAVRLPVHLTAEPDMQYSMPIPAGTTTIRLRRARTLGWWPSTGFGSIFRDVHVWARP